MFITNIFSGISLQRAIFIISSTAGFLFSLQRPFRKSIYRHRSRSTQTNGKLITNDFRYRRHPSANTTRSRIRITAPPFYVIVMGKWSVWGSYRCNKTKVPTYILKRLVIRFLRAVLLLQIRTLQSRLRNSAESSMSLYSDT